MSNHGAPNNREHRRSFPTVAFVFLCIALAALPPSAGGWDLYQVPWHAVVDGHPIIPNTFVQAHESLPFRNAAVVRYMACGDEIHFLRMLQEKKSDTDILGRVIGKMAFYAGLPDDQNHPTIPERDCTQTYTFGRAAPGLKFGPGFVSAEDAATLDGMSQPGGLAGGINSEFGAVIGGCPNLISSVVKRDNEIDVAFTIPHNCLRDQVNFALNQMSVTGHMGSSGVPCHVTSTTKEEDSNWDFSVRDLIRVLYLDERFHFDVLNTSVRNHIRNDLIVTRVELGGEDYSLLGCGNTEDATGDAESRADEGNFFDDVWDGLGDIGDWLLKHWYITFPVAWASAAAGGVVSQIPGATTTVIVAAGAADAIIQEVRITETENHLLMIETSRFLNNQLIIRDLKRDGHDDAADDVSDKNADVREWLLKRLRRILKEDFIEFNARPYQRESISAIQGLFDFSEDKDLKTAAQMVLEYAFAKFAVGSNQGRRLVPFRRRMEVIEAHIDKTESFFDLIEGADHQTALGLLYAAQTQQLVKRKVSFGAPAELIYASTSSFWPDDRIVDLAINKATPYLQRIHHAGVELYSSGKGFLITAGGVVTDYAYSGPLDTFANANDRGAGVPTTLMFPGASNKVTRGDLLAIDGRKESVEGSLGGARISYDHNACVWRGFACGINFQIPSDLNNCLSNGPPGSQAEWKFLDVAQCSGYGSNPAVFVAIYRQACGAAVDHCRDFGFFEAVDMPAGASFTAFQNKIIQNNPPGFVVTPPTMRAGGGTLDPLPLNGNYKTFGDKVIVFGCSAHLQDDDHSGISSADGQSIDDIDDWPLAEGDVITSSDKPVITIRNPSPGSKPLTLDFSKWNSPKRTP